MLLADISHKLERLTVDLSLSVPTGDRAGGSERAAGAERGDEAASERSGHGATGTARHRGTEITLLHYFVARHTRCSLLQAYELAVYIHM